MYRILLGCFWTLLIMLSRRHSRAEANSFRSRLVGLTNPPPFPSRVPPHVALHRGVVGRFTPSFDGNNKIDHPTLFFPASSRLYSLLVSWVERALTLTLVFIWTKQKSVVKFGAKRIILSSVWAAASAMSTLAAGGSGAYRQVVSPFTNQSNNSSSALITT
jgi:hypothetical protein